MRAHQHANRGWAPSADPQMVRKALVVQLQMRPKDKATSEVIYEAPELQLQ